MSKRIISIIAILLLVGGGLAFAGVQPLQTSTGGDVLGQGKQISDPHKIFRLVRYVPVGGTADSPTISNESIVIWDTTSADGVTVTTSTTSNDSRVAGILASNALTPDVLGRTATADALYGGRNWAWLQTFGYTLVKYAAGASGTVAAGRKITTSTTAGLACAFSTDPTTVGSSYTTAGPGLMGSAGFAYVAPAAAVNSEGAAFINLD